MNMSELNDLIFSITMGITFIIIAYGTFIKD